METAIQDLEFGVECRPMINKPPPFKGLNIRIPMIMPTKEKGCINQGSTLTSSLIHA